MCNYNYIRNIEDNTEERCCLKDRFKNEVLPYDEDGKCIFHSKDIKWKKENHFVNWLKKLVESFDIKEKNDLRGIQFVSDSSSKSIDYLELLENANLKDSFFHQELEVQNRAGIAGSLDFSNCSFHKGLSFVNCKFYATVKFENITVSFDESNTHKILFENCHFEEYFIFKNTQDLLAHLSFNKCYFKEEVIFKDFTNSNKSSFEFTECICEKNTEFEEVIILEWIDFSKTKFDHAVFKNCSFEGETSFNGIRVENNVNFIGDEDFRIFNGMTSFDIDFENLKGEISFQNANISNIYKLHKDRFLEVEKNTNGKVKIDSGCIKYRRVSPDYIFDIKSEHHHFILSLGGTFSNYFTKYNGFNLGVEVRSKTSKKITIFYYTDEDVDEDLFLQILEQTSEKVSSLFQNNHTINPEKDEELNLYIDIYSNLMKISNQIRLGKWNISDSSKILKPIIFSPKISIDAKDLHSNIRNLIPIEQAEEIKINISSTLNNYGEKSFIIGNLNSRPLPNNLSSKDEN